MTLALISALSLAVVFFATRWTRARDEVVTLRAQVASLKRQLRRGTAH